MKSSVKILTLSIILLLTGMFFPKPVKAQQENVSLQIFYDQLSPYGQWVDYLNYGYVWVPDVGVDFVPYSTSGHWVLTDLGWTWVSDFDWGWAPFHYGRWDFDNNYGWFWVPDTEWGPAWVTWRSADGYYGWEPMESGLSVNISFGRQYDRQNDHWQFVRDQDIERSNLRNYYIGQNDRSRIVMNSIVINNTYIDNNRHTSYVSGPRREDVQRVTGRNLTPVVIREYDKPGQVVLNGEIKIFRPQINKNNDRDKKPQPTRLIDIKDVKRPIDRNQVNHIQNNNPPVNNISKPNSVNPEIYKNNVKPVQQQNINPVNDHRRGQNPDNFKTPNNNNRPLVQPQMVKPTVPTTVVPTTVVPPTNVNRPQQPRPGNPQNNNVKPTVPQNVPPVNVIKQQQPVPVKPSNNPNVRPVQPQNPKPEANKNKQVPQPSTVKPKVIIKVVPIEKPKPNENK